MAAACVAVTAAAFMRALDVASRLAQTSDSAQGFVAGHAVASGNVLLSGWHLPLNDYYFTDTIPYAVLEELVGPRPSLLALVPALTYALFVLVALIACLRPSRPVGENIETGAAVALALAAPAWIGSWNPLLLSGMHVATVLAAFAALALSAAIAGGRGWKAWLGAGVALLALTSAIVASDPFSLVFAFGPVLAMLLVDAVTHRGSRNAYRVLSLLAGGIALGVLLPPVIAQLGGFTTESDVRTGFLAAPLIARNAEAMIFGVLTLFGANPLGTEIGWRTGFVLALRSIALAIAIVAFLRVARRLFRPQQAPLFDRLLAAGLLSLLAACALSAQFGKGITQQTITSGGPPMRYLMPLLLFGAVLAGRQIPEMLAAVTAPPARKVVRATLVLFAVLVFFAGGAGTEAQPRWIWSNPPAAAARWLGQYGLREGVGEYWSANLVTAMSGAAVEVRSVVPQQGRLVPYVWVEDRRWYAQAPQFVIWQDDNQTGVTFNDVRATYAVCRVEVVAGYRIAVLAPGRGKSAASC